MRYHYYKFNMYQGIINIYCSYRWDSIYQDKQSYKSFIRNTIQQDKLHIQYH